MQTSIIVVSVVGFILAVRWLFPDQGVKLHKRTLDRYINTDIIAYDDDGKEVVIKTGKSKTVEPPTWINKKEVGHD